MENIPYICRMKDFLNKNLVSLIVLALLVVVYLQRCGGNTPIAPINTHDTVTIIYHHYHDSTIVSKPTIVNHIPAQPKDIPPEAAPDTNYSLLLAQYNNLSQLYYSKNIAKDSLKIDSTGIVRTTDTIQRNGIVGRKWDYHFDIREKITTITNTIYSPQKRQLYFGGGILGNQSQFISGGEIGIFYKDRRDRVFKIGAQKLINQPITYGLSNYWKIKLRKGP